MKLLERRAIRVPALAGLFTALAVGMVRPTRLDSFRENLGDPALVTWIIAWPGRALVTNPTRLFQAPLYWPNADTYGYSDVLLTQSGPYWAFYGLTRSWTVSVICVGLLFSVLAETGAYLLAHRITGRRDAALVAAVSFAFSAYALGPWASPQLTSIGLVALALVALLRVFEAPSPLRGLVLAVASLAVFYGSLYYGALWFLLMGIACAVVVLHRLVRRHGSSVRLVVSLGLAAVLTGICVAPTAITLFRLQRDLNLTRSVTTEYDLLPGDLLRPAEGSYAWPRLLKRPIVPSVYEHRFFPGAVAIALGTLGLVWVIVTLARRRALAPEGRPRAGTDLGIVVAMGVAAFALAKGASGLGPLSPWRFVHDNVPGFSGIRATARLAVPAMLAGSVLAAVGYAAIARRWLQSRRLAGVAITAVVLLMCWVLAAPGRWAKLDTSAATLSVYRTLAEKPPGAVLELPMLDPAGADGAWAYVESPRLLYSTLDWHPRVNGYSGYAPPTYGEDVAAYATFPQPAAIDRLRSTRVRYVVVHIGLENGHPAFTEEQAAAIMAGLPPEATWQREDTAFLIDLG
jgi:hypothetical protein